MHVVYNCGQSTQSFQTKKPVLRQASMNFSTTASSTAGRSAITEETLDVSDVRYSARVVFKS